MASTPDHEQQLLKKVTQVWMQLYIGLRHAIYLYERMPVQVLAMNAQTIPSRSTGYSKLPSIMSKRCPYDLGVCPHFTSAC